MKFRKAIQLVILIFGVYGANINSMDPFNNSYSIYCADYDDYSGIGNSSQLDMFSTVQRIPNQQQINYQQRVQQQLSNQQEQVQSQINYQQQMQQMLLNQQISNQQRAQPNLQELLSAQPKLPSQQQNVQMTPLEQIEQRMAALVRGVSVVEKPKPLVARKPIALDRIDLDQSGGPVMEFIPPRTSSAGCAECRQKARTLPNKLVAPQWSFINSADEFLTHKYVADNDQYLPYPKLSKAFLNSNTVSVAEKIRRYKLSFDQVREANLATARQQLLNIEPTRMYIDVLNAREVIGELEIKYKNPDTQPNVAFIFSPTFYVLNKKRLNIRLPLDKRGLCPYPKPEDSSVCLKHYKQRFGEVHKHNCIVIKDKCAPEMAKDYDDMMKAIRETTIYSLLSGKQTRLIENKSIKKLCAF